MAFMMKRKSLADSQEAEPAVVGDQAQDLKGHTPVRKADKPPRETAKKLSSGSKDESGKKTRLSCDIAKRLHRRLRIAAAKDDTTIVAVIEKLIDTGINP